MLGGVKIEYIKNPHSLRTIKIFSWLIIIIFICSGLSNSIFFYHGLNNADAASAWTQTSEEDFNDNGTLTNLTIVGTGESAELKVYFSEITHWTEKQPTFSTTLWSRNQHEMAPIYGTNKILLFGGDTFRSRLKDTWVYDVDNNTWTNLILNPAPPGINLYGMESILG